MSRLELIHHLIQGSRDRAMRETAAAALVVVFFSGFFSGGTVNLAMRFGSALIVAGALAIVAVVWAHALSPRMLAAYPPGDSAHWLGVFHQQARLLRWVPLWYGSPICLGGWLFMLPSVWELPFGLMTASVVWLAVLAGLTILNRQAAGGVENMALQFSYEQGG